MVGRLCVYSINLKSRDLDSVRPLTQVTVEGTGKILGAAFDCLFPFISVLPALVTVSHAYIPLWLFILIPLTISPPVSLLMIQRQILSRLFPGRF